jgi:hypothetical protein
LRYIDQCMVVIAHNHIIPHLVSAIKFDLRKMALKGQVSTRSADLSSRHDDLIAAAFDDFGVAEQF